MQPVATRAPLAVAIVSGGLDSVTLAHLLHEEGYALHLLAVNYGQRHKKELRYARACARRLGARFDVVPLAGVGRLLAGSALTSEEVSVPDGHYAAESMRVTVVPNRNAILLAVAFGVAVAEGACVVATGVHAGDHFIYPDCRPGFIAAFEHMETLATEGFTVESGIVLRAPFLHVSKTEIARTAAKLGVPIEQTWSCYKGGTLHCGTCGTCVERREAFREAGVADPTIYACDTPEAAVSAPEGLPAEAVRVEARLG